MNYKLLKMKILNFIIFSAFGENCLKSRDSLLECACGSMEAAKICVSKNSLETCQKCNSVLGWISLKLECSGLYKVFPKNKTIYLIGSFLGAPSKK